MTESCSCITAHPPEKYDYKYAHTVGTICASTEVKVMGLDGNELGLNEPGEVRLKSTLCIGIPNLRQCYEDSSKRSPNHNGIPKQSQSHS